MAENKRKVVSYFPHRCQQSTTIDTYIDLFGAKGYMFWFRTLERLATSNGHVIDTRNKYKFLSYLNYVKLTAEEAREMIQLGVELEKFDRYLWENFGVIWYGDFVDNAKDAYRRRKEQPPTYEDAVAYAMSVGSCQDKTQSVVAVAKTDDEVLCHMPSRVEESRVEESRGDIVADATSTRTPSTTKKRKKFVKPTLDEVKDYISEHSYIVDAEKFMDHYESNGWKVGKNSMQDWKAAVRTWNKSEYNKHPPRKKQFDNQDFSKEANQW